MIDKALQLAKKSNTALQVVDGARTLFTAHSKNKEVTNQQELKRLQIQSQERVETLRIESQRDLLNDYFSSSFNQRAAALNVLFDTLDKGLHKDDNQVVSLSVKAIVDITNHTPLNGVYGVNQNNKDLNDHNQSNDYLSKSSDMDVVYDDNDF
jgi:hypothetical protein